MRRKKPAPTPIPSSAEELPVPLVPSAPPALALPFNKDDPKDVSRSIATLQGVLTEMLAPETGLTSGQTQDMAQMFIALLHMRGVTTAYWCQYSDAAHEVFALAADISAKEQIMQMPETPEPLKNALMSAIKLSVPEIVERLVPMRKALSELKQMPWPGFNTVH